MAWNRASKSIALVATVGMALTGCANGTSGTAANSGGSSGATTITLAAATFAEAGRGPKLTAWLDEFNASQKGVKVVPASIPYPTFGSTILTQMGGGVGPDLIRFDMPEYEAAVASKLIAPLDQAIDASKYDFIKGPDKFAVIDGKRYGVMFEIANYALIYNKDLIPTPPTTYDEFLAMAKAATKNGVYGLAFRQTMPEEAGMWTDLWNYVYGFGGSFSDGQKLTLNSPKVIEGLTAFKKAYDANVIPKGAPAATYRTLFGQGKVAMEIDNGGVSGVIQAMDANLHISAAPIPFPVKSQGAILAPIVVNEASKHKDAAATFLKWMLEPANQVKLQEVLGASSVATNTERSAAQLAKTPYLSVYDALTPTGLPQIVLGFEAKTPDIRKIVVEQVISVLQGNEDLKSAMDKAQQLATAAVGG